MPRRHRTCGKHSEKSNGTGGRGNGQAPMAVSNRSGRPWLVLLRRRQDKAQAEDHFVGAEGLVRLSFIQVQSMIPGVVNLIGIFQVYIPIESSAKRTFRPGIPSPELKSLVIGLAEEAVLRMRDDRADPELTEEVYFYLFIAGL